MPEQSLLSILEAHFGRPRVKGNYAYIRSPFNDADNNPSCAVLLEDSDRFTEGFFKDFSTGKSGNIYSLLGIPHNFRFRDKHKKLPALAYPSEAKFHISRFEYSPSKYLFNRGISYEVQEQFKVHEYDDRVSMPAFDKDGYFMYDVSRLTKEKGYANSAPTDAYPAFTHAVSSTDLVFVCESMIDAFTFFTVGLKAISLNGVANHTNIEEVFKDHYGKIVIAFDPDKAGWLNADIVLNKLGDKDVASLDLPYDVNECWTRMLEELDFDTAVVKFRAYIFRLLGIKQV